MNWMANMDLGETSISVIEELDMNKRMADREIGEVGTTENGKKNKGCAVRGVK